MKTIISVLFCSILGMAQGQNSWIQKTDCGGVKREDAIGFSIGTKGYIGLGYGCDSVCAFRDDFWEWDQLTNAWTQKADFAGGPGIDAVGFSVGTNGYIATGYGFGLGSKVWEWSQGSNTWTQKSNFGGGPRENAVAFTIGTKAYIGTGLDPVNFLFMRDFWEYDPSSDVWTQMTDFGGVGRQDAVGFSIGNKGYIGTGEDYPSSYYQDFWEWNQATNTWLQKANFAGSPRSGAVGFSIGTKGYIGTGNDFLGTQDFWEWNSSSNTWTQKALCGTIPRYSGVGFSIGSKGYIGTGYDDSNFDRSRDFWEYSPTVGIDELSEQIQSSVYPNPFSNSCTITLSKSLATARCILFDRSGKVVRELHINKQKEIKLERDGLPEGVFFYHIISPEGMLAAGKLIAL